MANTIERLDQLVVEEIMRIQQSLDYVLPPKSMLKSILISSFGKLTAEQRANIVNRLGPEWYLTLANKIEKEMLNGSI